MRRAVVLGVSGLNPDLVLRFLDELPALKQMRGALSEIAFLFSG